MEYSLFRRNSNIFLKTIVFNFRVIIYVVIAEIIDSELRKARIACSRCELSYTARNYRILYENQKLAFFKTTYKPLDTKRGKRRWKNMCHDCVFEYARAIAMEYGDEYIRVRIKSKDGTVTGMVFVEEGENPTGF